MPMFQRISDSILDHTGCTVDTNIRLSNGSRIEIAEGDKGRHFRLKFVHDGGGGWWVNRTALKELITELLYIRREVVDYWGEDDEVDPEEGPVDFA